MAIAHVGAGTVLLLTSVPSAAEVKGDIFADSKAAAGTVVTCFSFKTERTAREVPKKVKKTLCESSSFIKNDQHSIVFGLFFLSVSSGASLGASYLALLSFGCFWGAFRVSCGFF